MIDRKQTFKEIDFFVEILRKLKVLDPRERTFELLAKFGFGRFEKNVKKVHKGAKKPKHSQLFFIEMRLT